MQTEYVSHIVDAAHMRNIGEQSISNKIQAVLELVKNAYDGDARECMVRFYGEKTDHKTVKMTRIVIEDSGIGMTKNDIRNKLMKVGTANKIEYTHSPKFHRRVSGAKGMGHYSMQRLGTRTVITTTPEPYKGREFSSYDNSTYTLEIDWNDYVSGKDFQSISHKLTSSQSDGRYGTKIEITGLRDSWDISERDNDIQKLARNMENIMLPNVLESSEHAFSPAIEVSGFDVDLPQSKGGLLSYAPYKITASLRKDKIFLKIYQKPKRMSKSFEHALIASKVKKTVAMCGDADFTLYWFVSKPRRWAQGLFNSRELEMQLKENYGVRIYNDGVRIMPYGEKDNDWLGLDSRKAGPQSGGKVRNRILIGMIEITRENNPGIVETTTREAIKENAEFRSLREDFVMSAIEEFEYHVGQIITQEEEYAKKTKPGNIAQIEIERAQEKIDEVESLPLHQKESIKTNLTRASKQVTLQDRQNKKSEEMLVANVEMYRNLATVGIQTIAFNHEIIDPVAFVKGVLEILDNDRAGISEKDKKEFILEARKRIIYTINWADRIKEFSSILAGADVSKKKRSVISISKTLLEIRAGMLPILEASGIEMHEPVVAGYVPDIRINKASFESIFINLVSNSIRALKRVRNRTKTIKIHVSTSDAYILFRFEDNGYGIPDIYRDNIFRPFFTTYKSPDDRGTGMGLTIVKDIIETDYNGTVILQDTVCEEDDRGGGKTVFLIRLPIREVKQT